MVRQVGGVGFTDPYPFSAIQESLIINDQRPNPQIMDLFSAQEKRFDAL